MKQAWIAVVAIIIIVVAIVIVVKTFKKPAATQVQQATEQGIQTMTPDKYQQMMQGPGAGAAPAPSGQ